MRVIYHNYPNGQSLVGCIKAEIEYCERNNVDPDIQLHSNIWYACLSYFRQQPHFDNYINNLNL